MVLPNLVEPILAGLSPLPFVDGSRQLESNWLRFQLLDCLDDRLNWFKSCNKIKFKHGCRNCERLLNQYVKDQSPVLLIHFYFSRIEFESLPIWMNLTLFVICDSSTARGLFWRNVKCIEICCVFLASNK